MDKEGYEAARWFADRGITSFVLLHRLPAESWSDGPDVPLQDAQRAMRWVRAAAAIYELNRQCIGVMGFSAGAHVVEIWPQLVAAWIAETCAPQEPVSRAN